MKLQFKSPFKSKEYYFLLGVSNSKHTLLLIEHKESEFSVIDRWVFKNFNDNLKSIIKEKQYPLLLNLEGDNVISKQISKKLGYRNELLFKTNTNDFYFYEYQQEKQIFISIVRKNILDNLLQEIKSLGCFVLDVSIGSFVMVNLFNTFRYSPFLNSSIYQIEYANNHITSFKPWAESLNFEAENETYSNYELPLLSTFLNFKNPNEHITFENEFTDKNQTDYRYKTYLKKFITTGVFVLLMLIITSHFLRGYYVDALAQKSIEASFAIQQKEELSRLEEDKKIKEKILSSVDVLNKNYITKYISDVGNSVVNSIALNEINYQPLKKTIRSGQKITFQNKHLEVKGENYSDADFNKWLSNVSKFDWVKKITIVEYDQKTNAINTFILNIEI